MSIDDLAHRLSARFRLLRGGAHGVVAKHRTLQAAIEWSYHLLEPAEREMFDRLSVFAGGFTADAAAAICRDDGADDIDVAMVLDGLVARSMVDAEARTRPSRRPAGPTRLRAGSAVVRGGGQPAGCP